MPTNCPFFFFFYKLNVCSNTRNGEAFKQGESVKPYLFVLKLSGEKFGYSVDHILHRKKTPVETQRIKEFKRFDAAA